MNRADRRAGRRNKPLQGLHWRGHGSADLARAVASVTKTVPRKMRATFSLLYRDPRLVQLLEKTDHKTKAKWAIHCTERVLHYFEHQYPEDLRPRHAIETLQSWIDTGVFRMATIRKASLESHAAARDVGEDTPARSAARAAGQAVATAHVPTHSIGAAIYAVQAIYRSAGSANADALMAKERDWQYHRLLTLTEASHRALKKAARRRSAPTGKRGRRTREPTT